MTNFSRHKFEPIYTKIFDVAIKSWNTGRERKTTYKSKYVFFIALSTLKCESHWDHMGSMFRIKRSVFQRMDKIFLRQISEELYDSMLVEQRDRNTMRHVSAANKLFKSHPHALCATDVAFQETNRPAGDHQESKGIFSLKHKLYGYEVERSVFRTVLAARASVHRLGSVSDLKIFREMNDFHKATTEKGIDQLNIPDHGPW